ncbi:hypothetical protein LIER_36283 [Lithospermum erythrorhizon]|uniref:Glutathione S-transferase n=1 Tax=Lithospermum erythrorhizon TaxID=34254 RepID=A0AAV3P3Y6_LITER
MPTAENFPLATDFLMPPKSFHRDLQTAISLSLLDPSIATTDDVKFLGFWPSPFVMRAHIALAIKSINYEFIEEPFLGPKVSSLSNRILFTRKSLSSSMEMARPFVKLVIVQYIDEKWSSAHLQILPSDSYDLAIARFWAAYFDDKCYPSLQEMVIKLFSNAA